ncbi:MAG: hypothetical protein IH595_12060 [Bacteroidales bacterium]|nr:hypothetical protein [Bacteroidales bacterium]
MKKLLLISFLIISATYLYSQNWNPNAGLILPYSAKVTVSSGTNPQNITDGNPHTYWESGNPLPFHYLQQSGSNYLLNEETFSSSLSKEETQAAFDGNTNTKADITEGKLSLILKKSTDLKIITIKASVSDSLQIFVTNSQNQTERFSYSTQDNYQLKNFKIALQGEIHKIQLVSNKGFGLFELGALNGFPTESVNFDFGKIRSIGWISSRHLNLDVVRNIDVLISNDTVHWQKILNLNPQAIPLLEIPLNKTYEARYLKIIFTLSLKDYDKSKLWEFDVYGPYGPYGRPPLAKPSALSYADAFGLNTIWGWGYSVYSNLLKTGQGPSMFRKVCTQLRTYHPLDWDMKNAQNLPDFNKMATQGTPAKHWLNWDREYGNWKKFGFKIDIALTFKEDNFPDSLWKNPFQEAFNFGKKFASHFYNQTNLINTIEIGNEPWNYPPEVYRKILLGMSEGIKSVSGITVLPCAVQAYDPTLDDNNYISNYIGPQQAQFLDGLNTHLYSYVFKENGIHVAVNPEDPRSQIWSMANLVRFRNVNMPGKPIYVTEFGYDSKGGGEDCTHSECVSELEQAIYGVRIAMILWRLGARQLDWYFFANVPYKSFLHNRSGLTGSYNSRFKPKLSFTVFQNLLQKIGPYHFEKVLEENQQVYAYLLKNPDIGDEMIIAWRPTSKNHKEEKWEDIYFDKKISTVKQIISLTEIPFSQGKGLLKVKLSGIPVLIKLKP